MHVGHGICATEVSDLQKKHVISTLLARKRVVRDSFRAESRRGGG
jgi:hypothetical protein